MANNPYAAPSADISEPAIHRSYSGLRRLPFFGCSVGLTVLYMVGLMLGGQEPTIALISVGLVLVGSIYLYVLRFRNQDSSGLWALGMFVPILNIYTGLRAMAFPEGYADHRTLDTPAKILIGVWLAFFVLGIGAAILLPAILQQ